MILFITVGYEVRTLLLNDVSVSDTHMTPVGHVKCPIQKLFVRFLTILVRF